MNVLKQIPDEIIRQDLKQLINAGWLNTGILSNITKISKEWFEDYLNENPDIKDISDNDICFLTSTVSILSLGMEIDCDSRLNGILDVFTQIYNFDITTLALCAGIKRDLLEDFITDPSSITDAEKYRLAVKIMFLYYIFKFPDYSKC